MLPDKVPRCHYDEPQIGLAQPFSHEVFGIQCQQELCAAFHRGRQYMGVVRTTYLIDAEGTVVRRWDKVKVDGHADEVLAAVKAL